jgi:TatD DNase family protein
VLIPPATAHGIADGSVTLAFRRWDRPRMRPGSTQRTVAGVVEVTAVEPVDPDRLTEDDAARAGTRSLAELRRLLAAEWVVGVGETGLDYYRDRAPRDVQRAAFAAHVRLARELDKALVVHCREAFADVLAVLEGEGAPPRTVFHCFAGDERAAGRVVEAGWYVSFAGTVTFRNAPGLRAACAVVPLERMVLETDSPFLSPHPYRGQPNRPGRVAVTARTVAEVHEVPVEQVAEATTATATRAFGLDLDGRG